MAISLVQDDSDHLFLDISKQIQQCYRGAILVQWDAKVLFYKKGFSNQPSLF